MTTAIPDFTVVTKHASQGLVLKPLLMAYLSRSKFPAHTVRLEFDGGREPDDHFHPSTHPLMDEMMLYQYLANPKDWEQEPIDHQSRMAITMGSIVHSFIQSCIRSGGWMAPLPEGRCVACGLQHGLRKGQCDEFGVADPRLGRRGHMDGLLSITDRFPGLEFKTASGRLYDVEDNDLEWYTKKHPEYYAQNQEYMDISGLPGFTVLFQGMGMPWSFVEIQVPYDPEFASKVRSKYERVRRAQQLGQAPDPCCAPRSAKTRRCPALACPMKRI